MEANVTDNFKIHYITTAAAALLEAANIKGGKSGGLSNLVSAIANAKIPMTAEEVADVMCPNHADYQGAPFGIGGYRVLMVKSKPRHLGGDDE